MKRRTPENPIVPALPPEGENKNGS